MTCVGQVFKDFEAASGMWVNLDKSEISFSRNTPGHFQEELARILCVRVMEKHVKYLGLPTLVGRSKKEIFQSFKDWIWKQIQSWRCKNLSQASKAVLLQSVVQAMPTYIIGCFLIPSSICREIEGLMADFLWHNREITIAPNTLHPEATIVVLLDEAGKWKEAQIRAVYRPDYIDAILGITANLESLDHLCWHYEKNGRYSVKSGYRLLHQGLAPFVHGRGTGLTSYQVANWKFIWKAKVPPKVRLFVLRAFRSSLPTVTNLAQLGVNVGGVYPRCGLEEEDVLHYLLRCQFARLV
ncbi:UNVERIFIED_CONTAM: hypothetical protein Sradi_6994400 [Sesamum radiatum]|uniref:Reverse transcriptase zinc-binding domain-containing protein n=1 Tax=Sesamum radiatum TaxID=300843 RepID=A0AAW2JDP1_SESRA